MFVANDLVLLRRELPASEHLIPSLPSMADPAPVGD
jgi:hypothetical protein